MTATEKTVPIGPKHRAGGAMPVPKPKPIGPRPVTRFDVELLRSMRPAGDGGWRGSLVERFSMRRWHWRLYVRGQLFAVETGFTWTEGGAERAARTAAERSSVLPRHACARSYTIDI